MSRKAKNKLSLQKIFFLSKYDLSKKNIQELSQHITNYSEYIEKLIP